MTQPQPLTFEQFVERVPLGHPVENDPGIPRYNTFPLNFTTEGPAADLIRKQPHVVRFIEEHPGLEGKLREGIMNRDRLIDTSEALKPFERNMYEAYLIMRDYGVSDEDLCR